MAAHAHTLHHGAPLDVAAKAALEASGEQWTDMRARVFDALAGFDRPASAYDIAEAMSKSEGRRIAANSIYRILDLFVAANVARRVESANAFLVNEHPDCIHDCIFLICDNCGHTTHIDDDAVTGAVRAAAGATGFGVSRPVIEVRGVCKACG
ncbi:Fur family transcriptional regulator [Sphingomonas sp. SUN039]|uniref:Fur family transcriptional regulator n=1 Tax=Sphingomonas sp. SUN039 TaxID=2937787 RepID=UPI002164E31C|nr:transcriptional repressor [Sphingomonas sp. SUN039]UVO54598.1 transcriptional repressor [Sphingomonas sp. SUN039]